MDEFSYLSVLVSIIIGLAVTEILQGLRRLLLSRRRVRIYWPVIGWAFLLPLIATQSWWTMFGLRAIHDWTFAMFGIVLLQAVVLYMQAGLVFPEFSEDHDVDLKTHYYAHNRWFFGMFALLLIVSLAKSLIISGALPGRVDVGFHVVLFVWSIIAIFVRRTWYHHLLIIATTVGILLYIITLFTQLH